MNDFSTPRELPAEISERLTEWHQILKRASIYHYTLGICGVTASALAAAFDGSVSKLLAAASAACIAALGFAKPERRYLKFVRAWRVLDSAAMRYRYHKLSDTELLNAVEQGERMITEFELETLRPKPAVEQKNRDHAEDAGAAE